MSNKKEVLNKDTEFSIKLSKKHPNNKMLINGVEIQGYVAKNYVLPKGTDLSLAEITSWFIIEKPVDEKPVKAAAKAPKE